MAVFFIHVLTLLPYDISNAIGVRKTSDMIEKEKVLKGKLSKHPDDHVSITALGELHWENGSRKVAIRLFKKAMKIAPGYPLPYFFLARAYFFEKNPKKGKVQFDIFEEKMDILIAEDKSNGIFYTSCLSKMARLFVTRNMHDEALRIYRKIAELEPLNQRAHYNMAVCYYSFFHNRSRAYKELKIVMEIGTDRNLSDKAAFFIDYMRNNPDSRYTEDFSFIESGD